MKMLFITIILLCCVSCARTTYTSHTVSHSNSGADLRDLNHDIPSSALLPSNANNNVTSYNLSGRTITGILPATAYPPLAQENGIQGRVIIEIAVNPNGQVVNATFRSQGSTTNDSELIRAAIEAARKVQFNKADDAPQRQQGTITYNFALR